MPIDGMSSAWWFGGRRAAMAAGYPSTTLLESVFQFPMQKSVRWSGHPSNGGGTGQQPTAHATAPLIKGGFCDTD